MFIIESLRLNNHNRNTVAIFRKNRAMRQANIRMNYPNFLCVLNIKNRSAILHILLNRNPTLEAGSKLPSL